MCLNFLEYQVGYILSRRDIDMYAVIIQPKLFDILWTKYINKSIS